MTMKKKPEDLLDPGRPTDYKSEHDVLVYKLCLLGSTDAQIADILEVTERTINNWKHDHPSFFQSMKRGKDIADAEVAESLFHRAKGYSHSEDKIFNNNGEALIVPTTKHYPPETIAGIFWLKNRQPDKFRDRKDIHITDDLIAVKEGMEKDIQDHGIFSDRSPADNSESGQE